MLADTPPHPRSVSSSGTRVQGGAGRWECIWPDLVPFIMGATPHTNGQRTPQTTQFTVLLLKGEKQAQGKGCGANEEALRPKWFPQFSRFSVTPILSTKLGSSTPGRRVVGTHLLYAPLRQPALGPLIRSSLTSPQEQPGMQRPLGVPVGQGVPYACGQSHI